MPAVPVPVAPAPVPAQAVPVRAQAAPVPAQAVRARPAAAAALLAAHVPLSLLMDLADPAGPRSSDLLAAEPGSADWLRQAC